MPFRVRHELLARVITPNTLLVGRKVKKYLEGGVDFLQPRGCLVNGVLGLCREKGRGRPETSVYWLPWDVKHMTSSVGLH